MKAKHIVIRVILLVLISLLSLALTAVGVFAVLGWNMHSEAIEARPCLLYTSPSPRDS